MGSPKTEDRRLKEGRRPKAEGERAGLHPGLRFDQFPLAVQRRCVQVQLMRLGIEPDYELVEQLRIRADRPVAISSARAGGGARTERAGQSPTACVARPMDRDGDARRTGGAPALRYTVRDDLGIVHLRAQEAAEFSDSSVEVELGSGAGEVEFDGARIGWRIKARKGVGQPKAGVRGELFDADQVGMVIRLRHWRPGDRFQPIGMACPVKLQDFFTNQKVPRDRRRRLIVAAAANGEVFWVEGMRISERFKLTKWTIRCLQWRWKRL